MTVRASALESDRFGYRIGRADVDVDADLAGLGEQVDGYDVVFLRAPAAMRSLPGHLTRLANHVALAADHLCYWEWTTDRVQPVEPPDGMAITDDATSAEIVGVVRATFAGYGNHYAANPLFDQVDVLDGYCEWAAGLVETSGCCVLRDRDGDVVGFALVDWDAEVPDIRLAGMRPDAQGHGLYAVVLHAVMADATARGRAPIRISTQSDNVNVMRAWARLGLLPHSTTATFHLVRRALLQGAEQA